MEHAGLIKPYGPGYVYKIEPKGILFAEDNSIINSEMINLNRNARTQIIDECAKEFDLKGEYGSVHYQTIADTTGVDSYLIVKNVILLENLSILEPYASGFSKITEYGLEVVGKWRKEKEIVEEFERISKLQPQIRGIELQNVFANIADQQGWEKEVSVKTNNEEVDVIIFRDRDFFLIECKWEKNKTEAKVIRDFYGKLKLREGVKGIVLSISGFTKGAKESVISYVGDRSIILIGEKDIKSLIYAHKNLEELINEKYRLLITRREVLVL